MVEVALGKSVMVGEGSAVGVVVKVGDGNGVNGAVGGRDTGAATVVAGDDMQPVKNSIARRR